MRRIKLKELIEMDIDIEVYDDVTQELDMSFVGPIKLTEEGQKEFKEVLEYNVTLYEDEKYAIVKCADEEPEIKWIIKFKKAFKFFKTCAGYCSTKEYDKWFKEEK